MYLMDLSLGMKYTNMIIVAILALSFLNQAPFPCQYSGLVKCLAHLTGALLCFACFRG